MRDFFRKVAYSNPFTRQAIVNHKYIPQARKLREAGQYFVTTITPAPLFTYAGDLQKLVFRRFKGQYSVAGESTIRWSDLDDRPCDHFAIGVMKYSLDGKSWIAKVFNVQSRTNPEAVHNAITFVFHDTNESLLIMQQLEILNHLLRGERDQPMFEDVAIEKGSSYPSNHFLNFQYRLEGGGMRGAEAEMMSRKAHALIHGRDLRGNFSFGDADKRGTVLRPHLYHHF